MRISDWSSDVGSSDVLHDGLLRRQLVVVAGDLEFQPRIRQPLGHEAEMIEAVLRHRRGRAGQRIDKRDADGLRAGRDSTENHSRSEEHTSELQSLMRISYAAFCLKNNKC